MFLDYLVEAFHLTIRLWPIFSHSFLLDTPRLKSCFELCGGEVESVVRLEHFRIAVLSEDGIQPL